MTTAICFKCGAFKHGAFTECESCGTIPLSQKSKADSIALSDHHYDELSLIKFSCEIRAGQAPSVDPSISSAFLETMNSGIGQFAMNIFQDVPDDEDEEEEEEEEEELDLSQEIASRLIMIESHFPGSVRMNHNPFVITQVVRILKDMGYQKPFFTSNHQFVYNTVLAYVPPMARILPACLLAGPSNNENMVRCWNGSGHFIGLQGLFQLSDFTSGGKDRMPLSINIDPFFNKISDLLEEPTD